MDCSRSMKNWKHNPSSRFVNWGSYEVLIDCDYFDIIIIILLPLKTKFKIIDTDKLTNFHAGSGRPSKITLHVLHIVENQMSTDDETTAIQ